MWFATASEITDYYLEHYYDTDARRLGLTDEVRA